MVASMAYAILPETRRDSVNRLEAPVICERATVLK